MSNKINQQMSFKIKQVCYKQNKMNMKIYKNRLD